MKKCIKCGIQFDTNRYTCPFCKVNLVNCDKPNIKIVRQDYPKFKEEVKKQNIVLNLFIFLTIFAIVICALISYFANSKEKGFYALLIVAASLLVCWLFIKGVILSKMNFPMRIISFAFSLIILFAIIEYDLSNDSWVLNYLLSFILTSALITIVFAMFLKISRFKNYITLLIGLCFLNCIPICLYELELINVLWPAFVACSCGLSVLLGMLVFGFKATMLELKKRFHA